VGIGVGLGAALLIAAVIIFWRRSRKHAKAAHASSAHIFSSDLPPSGKWPQEHTVSNNATTQPSYASADSKSPHPYFSEMAENRGLQEMAGRQLEPQELPANSWR